MKTVSMACREREGGNGEGWDGKEGKGGKYIFGEVRHLHATKGSGPASNK